MNSNWRKIYMILFVCYIKHLLRGRESNIQDIAFYHNDTRTTNNVSQKLVPSKMISSGAKPCIFCLSRSLNCWSCPNRAANLRRSSSRMRNQFSWRVASSNSAFSRSTSSSVSTWIRFLEQNHVYIHGVRYIWDVTI